jgi:alkylation response protein AidB-like acyl-CoA dehydrogenase
MMVHAPRSSSASFRRSSRKGWDLAGLHGTRSRPDLASLRTRGVRDGDVYVVNGSKQFVGSPRKPDFLYTLVNTNPDAPRHENISAFLIPAKLPGITIAPMDLIGGGGKQFVFFDNVNVPADCLIGQEGKGCIATT